METITELWKKDAPVFSAGEKTSFYLRRDAARAGLKAHRDFSVIGARRASSKAKRGRSGELAEIKRKEAWVSVPVDEHWVAAYRLIPENGRPVIGEVRVIPRESNKPDLNNVGEWSVEFLGGKAVVPPGGISARLLRGVRVGACGRFVNEFVAWITKNRDEGYDEFGAFGELDFKVSDSRRDTRLGRPDVFYAHIAQEYANAVERGSSSPIWDIAKRRRIPRSKVRDMIRQARLRGLLSRGPRGKSEGFLTERGRALLKEESCKEMEISGKVASLKSRAPRY